jgi:acyl-CoA thioesterase II
MTGAESLVALLAPVAKDARWTMNASRALSLGPADAKHMSGGAQLAAIVALLEEETQLPLIQAACQFRKSPLSGEDFELHIDYLHRGRSITLAEISLVTRGKVGTKATASLGARPDIGAYQWRTAPQAPEPAQCPPLPFIRSDAGDLHRYLDVRIIRAAGDNAAGQLAYWVRWNGDGPVPNAFLTIIADYLPEALHFNLGRPAGASSLDNAIRILGSADTDWLLCHTQLSAMSNGLFHGTMDIYAQNGKLLALASQSAVARLI